jgi:hypothetical protein
MTLRCPGGRWLATCLLAAWPLAQASEAPPPVVYGPGVWPLDTPQAFAADGVLELQIHGIAAGPCDPCVPTLVFKQSVNFDGTLRVTMNDHSFMYASLTYWLFNYWGGLPSGRFSRIELPGFVPSLGWNTDSLYVNGYIMVQSPLAVPEPSTGALWLAGLALAGGVARRRHRA